MNSQAHNIEMPFPTPYPDASQLANLMPVSPVQPGFYGQDWTKTILVTTNFLPVLDKIGRSEISSLVTVLCLDAAGFSPKDAVAMGTLDRQKSQTLLAMAPRPSSTARCDLLVPVSLAKALYWEAWSQFGPWAVRLVPDDLDQLPVFLRQTESLKPLPATSFHLVGVRFLVGLKILSLQVLILSLPLFVFGWETLIKSLMALVISTMTLVLGWRILPGNGSIKGLLVGFSLSIILVLVLNLVLDWELSLAVLPALGLLVSSSWMGTVLSGAK